jgi:hypothetical protein
MADEGGPEDQQNMMRSVARSVASGQYVIARQRVADGMRFDNEALLETDEDILTEAVRVTATGR